MSENEKKSTEEKVTSSDFENVLHGNSEKAKGLKYIDACEKMKKSREQFNSILNPSPIDLRIQENLAAIYQIKNHEALKAITNAQKNFEKTRELLTSMLPNTPPLADRFKIQEYVAKVFAAPQVNNAAIAAYQKMGEALQNAAMSGSVKEYQENIQTALTAEKEFSNSRCNSQNEKSSDITKEALKEIGSNVNEENLPERKNQALDLFGDLSFQNVAKKLIDIETLLRNFLRQFKIIALRNERSSATNACWSKWLAIIAIFISVVGILASGSIQWYFSYRAEKNDKTGELIEVVQRTHPWSGQQISANDAENVSVAFHAITEALQKNVQLEKGTVRLQADLSKAQGDLAALQKQYNDSAASFSQEKQKFHAEITALKKQIEELKAELVKRQLSLKNPNQAKTLNAMKSKGEK